MTTEHFLSDDVRGMRLFIEVGSRLAKALIPQVAIDLIRVGRLTALSKSEPLLVGFKGLSPATWCGVWSHGRWRNSCPKQWNGQLHPSSVPSRRGQGASVLHMFCKASPSSTLN